MGCRSVRLRPRLPCDFFDPVVNFISASSTIETFPLERPLLRSRSRSARSTVAATAGSLAYFISGEENRLATFVCQSDTATVLSQPVLLIGPPGCGRTRLSLHLAAKLATELNLGGDYDAVRYVSATDFAREYAEAIAADDLPPLRDAFDEVPILVLDDLQQIAGKSAVQDELSLRIDRRIATGFPTIITSRRLPSETRGIRPQLSSRCVVGLTVPINYPGPDSRLAILRELAMVRGLEISDDLLGLLNAGLRNDLSVGSLESAIKQVDLYCRMHRCSVDVAAIQASINSVSGRSEIDLAKITRTVARVWGHRTKDLRSSSRKQSVVRARSLAMLLARQLTSNSLDKIGDYFGGRDHSTVLHAIRKTETLLDNDDDLSRMMQEVTEKLAV